MKRELAFALEARSQFSCFVGRTRSSKTSPAQLTDSRTKNTDVSFIDHCAKSIEEVHVNRRSKKVKTAIPVGDSVTVDRFNGSEDSAAAEVAPAAVEMVNVEEESAASDVLEGGDETPAVEVAKAETRVGDWWKRKNLELKMSKKIGLGRVPFNMRELLETGLLEGFHVSYDFDIKGKNLRGIIKGVGILCSCSCVISPSQFEMHACKSYRHAIKHIRLENGKSLLEMIEICKASASESVEVALQNVISSLPVKDLSCVQSAMVIKVSFEVRQKSWKLSSRSASVPRSIKSVTKRTSSQQEDLKKLTIKNHQLHWSVFQKGGLPDGTELTYFSRGKKQLDGYKWAKEYFVPVAKLLSVPHSLKLMLVGPHTKNREFLLYSYGNIYISNGVSLHEYAVSLKKTENQRCPVKFNDDICRVCRDGGDLLLCDGWMP
ncbi:hypothetical protein E3N88_42159 [Mikania micrantha]|uniref:Tify domain-containing protein n=1 Tax=Mikania micrantha TaxID=192012 RepID=A0A5N6LII3_9ASTR|nr:hypothetical protein E3N88_42159 [Mikania micrantha]